MDMTFVSTCWVVERRTASKNEYASWEISYEEQGLIVGDRPIIQRNDLLKIKGYRTPRVYCGRCALNQNYCMVYDPKHRGKENHEETYSYETLMQSIKTVHRPTPEGMKQVWPEVEG